MRLLDVKRGGVYLDGTVGAGGHAARLMQAAGGEGHLIGIDRDPVALEKARSYLSTVGTSFTLKKGNYTQMREIAEKSGYAKVDGVLLDIGMSSMQVDDPERGFSFMRDGSLDMRMDRDQRTTAEEIVNTTPEEELRDIIRIYGEEWKAGRIVRAIVNARQKKPILRTLELADIVARSVGGRRGRLHPATRTFQALRIAVNDELNCLKTGLEEGVRLLREGGRMAVISFHSLEDREVKNFVKNNSSKTESGGRGFFLEPVTKKPVIATENEKSVNPRARSAKLRVFILKSEGDC